MIVRYRREEGEEHGKWSFAWDGPAAFAAVRDTLVILACARYLGFY